MANNKKKVEQQIPQRKIKIAAYMDSVSCATGFGTVARNILSGLYNTGIYDIEQWAINYWGQKHSFPWWQRIVGLNNDKDPYGRKKVFAELLQEEFDLLFCLQDTFILDFLPELHKQARTRGKEFRSIVYYPIDGVPKEQWVRNIEACDYVVTYSQFAKEQSLEVLPSMRPPLVIPHGSNTKDFFILPEKDVRAFRAQFFGSQADKFIFTNLNRNQQRKDIPRTIQAFAEFKKQVPDSILYLHMAKKDQGWDLPEIIKGHGLSISEDVIFPENFGPNQGYPLNIVNAIYNSSDCVVSTTLGEGFGLAWIEAMCTKTPVIVPNNTAMTEFVTDERGWKTKSGTNPSLFTVVPNDNEVIRPLVDVEDMVKVMLEVYNNREEAARRAENAYNWVTTQMEWQTCIVPQWVKVFNYAYMDLKRGERKVEIPGTDVIDAESF
jgi:glycosyltransferase involved in cell wall biosynthesis